jgi:predicted RNase H-like HicB family nuclease
MQQRRKSVMAYGLRGGETVWRWRENRDQHIISSMANVEISILMESNAAGYFVSCPALQGCYGQGNTYEEAVKNIKDVIRLHLEDQLVGK